MPNAYGLPTDDEVKGMLYNGLVRNYAEEQLTKAQWAAAEKKGRATLRKLGARGARQAVATIIQSNTYGRKPLCATEAAEQVLQAKAMAKGSRQ